MAGPTASSNTAGMTSKRRTAIGLPYWMVLVALSLSMVGCGVIGMVTEPRGGPYPDACAQWKYTERRCDAIVGDAMDAAGLDDADVSSIELLPFERVQTLGGGQVGLVRFTLADGRVVDQDVQCVGVSERPACNDSAEIRVMDGIDHDTPCSGEPPAVCATLPPTPDPEALAAATPFRLDAVDIPLDHKGTYEVRIGKATLPDGYLSEPSFRLADSRPTRFWLADGGVYLDIRSDVPGRPFVGSVFRDPFDGPEPVTLYLVFKVTHLEGPSTLQVWDVDVH